MLSYIILEGDKFVCVDNTMVKRPMKQPEHPVPPKFGEKERKSVY